MTTTTSTTKLAHEDFFEDLIRREYSRLAKGKHTYLDYTGGNLYAASQIQQHQALLREEVLGNPHSTNPSSKLSTRLVEEARKTVLEFFKATDYYCIFTANASGALKIVGECYPFDEDSELLLLSDNHNSVNGIREYCRKQGGEIDYCPVNYQDLRIETEELDKRLTAPASGENRLFAYPAQSNVSGVQHDLNWVNRAQAKGWDVLLDAAAFVPTSPLDLQQVQPDFVALSFYKIFGYPTGLGCLLVRKDKFKKLEKHWFAGGTVKLAAVGSCHHFLADDHERFENGTVNYLDIPAITIGLNFIRSIGMQRIKERVASLSDYLNEGLKQINQKLGWELVRGFGPTDRHNCGGTIILRFFHADGLAYPFEEVEAKANARNISIRSGCFCNPGLDEINNHLQAAELDRYFSNRQDGNYHEMIEELGRMRGATRVSVGIATSRADIDRFLEFVISLAD